MHQLEEENSRLQDNLKFLEQQLQQRWVNSALFASDHVAGEQRIVGKDAWRVERLFEQQLQQRLATLKCAVITEQETAQLQDWWRGS
jgi:hypothetical protein